MKDPTVLDVYQMLKTSGKDYYISMNGRVLYVLVAQMGLAFFAGPQFDQMVDAEIRSFVEENLN